MSSFCAMCWVVTDDWRSWAHPLFSLEAIDLQKASNSDGYLLRKSLRDITIEEVSPKLWNVNTRCSPFYCWFSENCRFYLRSRSRTDTASLRCCCMWWGMQKFLETWWLTSSNSSTVRRKSQRINNNNHVHMWSTNTGRAFLLYLPTVRIIRISNLDAETGQLRACSNGVSFGTLQLLASW